MKTKILILIAAVWAMVAQAQTNCSTVAWRWNTNNPSSLRLRVAGYVDGTTLPVPCDTNFVCDDGLGKTWNGSFLHVNASDAGSIRYEAELATFTIAGRRLWLEPFVFWDGPSNRWGMELIQQGSIPSIGYYGPRNLWIGYLSGTNPIGAYVKFADANGTGPSTLTVECYTPQPSKCQIDLSLYPSPRGATNGGTTGCTLDIYAKRFDASGYLMPREMDVSGFQAMTDIKDGDRIAITWPRCCDSAWGIAAEGPLVSYFAGTPFATNRITLCIPDGAGVVPISQVTSMTDTTGGPGNLMRRPYSEFSIAPPPTNGFNGCMWVAHINCLSCETDDPPYPNCKVWFESQGAIKCGTLGHPVRWASNQLDPHDSNNPNKKPYVDTIDVFLDVNGVLGTPPPVASLMIDSSNWRTSTVSGGFSYQWYGGH